MTLQEPIYKEIGCNITSSDGFFYVPILSSIQTLLNHPLVFEQVCTHAVIFKALASILLYIYFYIR